MNFTDLLTKLNVYFYMDNLIDRNTMCPIIQFTSRYTGLVYQYKIPSVDIHDYPKKSTKIEQMLYELTSTIRDEKITNILYV